MSGEVGAGWSPGQSINLRHLGSCSSWRPPESCLQQVACLLPPHFWPVPSRIRTGALTNSSWSHEWPLVRMSGKEGGSSVWDLCPHHQDSTASRCGSMLLEISYSPPKGPPTPSLGLRPFSPTVCRGRRDSPRPLAYQQGVHPGEPYAPGSGTSGVRENPRQPRAPQVPKIPLAGQFGMGLFCPALASPVPEYATERTSPF